MGLRGHMDIDTWNALRALAAPPPVSPAPPPRRDQPGRATPSSVPPVPKAFNSPSPPPPRPTERRTRDSPGPRDAKPRDTQSRRRKKNTKFPARNSPAARQSSPPRRQSATPTASSYQMHLTQFWYTIQSIDQYSRLNGRPPNLNRALILRLNDLEDYLATHFRVAGVKEREQFERLRKSLAAQLQAQPQERVTPSTPTPPRVPTQSQRAWKPRDISAIPIGPESDRWFMDSTSSK